MVKIIVISWTEQKLVMGTVWPVGHSSLTPGSGFLNLHVCHLLLKVFECLAIKMFYGFLLINLVSVVLQLYLGLN